MSATAQADQETLQLDSFMSGQPASFQGGFAANEIAAVRLVPTIPCPCRVTGVVYLFGAGVGTQPVGVHVWEDDLGANDPGTELLSVAFDVTGSDTNFQLSDISSENVIVNGPFRVGLEMVIPPTPTFATDLDGNIDASANFLFADLGGAFLWLPSNVFGLTGDWIIRANIETVESLPAMGPSGHLVIVFIIIATGAGAHHIRRLALESEGGGRISS